MKKNMRKSVGLIIAVTVIFGLAPTPASLIAAPARAQARATQAPLSAADKRVVTAFEKRVKEYAKLRERIEGRMPKLSKDARPEQIEAHKKTFQQRVSAARATAKPGQLFRPDVAKLIRATIKDEFKGKERQELRQEVLVEADNKAVAVRVNQPYPETQEMLEMPPTLLLRLPQLPKQVKYRFVGRNMLLVDRENGLIIDYMTDALP